MNDNKERDIVRNIPISHIVTSSDNPRKSFDEESIALMASSIVTHGILQPIKVKQTSDGKYNIIFGERRFKAMQKLYADSKEEKYSKIPAIVNNAILKERTLLELRLIENISRENLNAIDRALALQQYKDYMVEADVEIKDKDIAKKTGLTPSEFSKSLSLTKLPEEIHDLFRFPAKNDKSKYVLGQTHGLILLKLEDEASIINMAQKAFDEKMRRSRLEYLVKKERVANKDPVIPTDVVMKATSWLTDLLVSRGVEAQDISIKSKGKRKTTVTITFKNVELEDDFRKAFNDIEVDVEDMLALKEEPDSKTANCIESNKPMVLHYSIDDVEIISIKKIDLAKNGSKRVDKMESDSLLHAIYNKQANLVSEKYLSGNSLEAVYTWNDVDYVVVFDKDYDIPHHTT